MENAKPFCQCLYCHSRMLPRVMPDGWIAYVCSNDDCKAVSPHDRSFTRALNKAQNRADVVLEWYDREEYEPAQQGEYLCEYTFINPAFPDAPPVMTFYGVQRFDVYSRRFNHEKVQADGFGHRLKILRWMDFGGAATRKDAGSPRKVEVRK